MMKKLFVLLATGFVLFACSSKKPEATNNAPPTVKMPTWVYAPQIDDGIASAQCVKFSGNISLDQQQVTAFGRASLAQQINVRAQVMDKTYQNRTDAEGKTVTGSVFESVSRQLTDENIRGSKLLKTEFGTIGSDSYLCGLVGISAAETKKVFDTIASNSQAPKVSAQDKSILYQEFKSYKAQQDLQQALGGGTVAPSSSAPAAQ